MCIGVAVYLTQCDGICGTGLENGAPVLIDLSLTPEAKPGDWVLTFLDAAREVISEDQALKIAAALNGLRSVMLGGDIGDAFADIEAREPELPPHLQAALAAGRATA